MKSRFLCRAGALLLAMALVCSLLALPAAADDPVTYPVSFVEINKESLTLAKGAKETLTASVYPDEAANKNINWSSSNDSVAAVSGNGEVTAVAGGTATITATSEDGGKTATCAVIVTVAAERVILEAPKLSVAVNEEVDLPTAVLYPADTTDSLEWETLDSDIARIVGEKLRGVNKGTTTLVAKAGGKTSNACTVTVSGPAITGVELSDTSLNLSPGDSRIITATVVGHGDFPKSVTWESSDPSFVSVGQTTGKVMVDPNAPVGTRATITAKAAADATKDATCVVTVAAPRTPDVESVNITSPDTNAYRYVDIGSSFTLHALTSPADVSEADRTVSWSSSDPSIATVDSSGKVTGKATGSTVITASAGGMSASREIEVSGIKLSYIEKSPGGGKGTTKELTSASVVDIYQYRDISVTVTPYGTARNKTVNWESSNNTVAQVISGRVTGNYPGDNAIITASVAGTAYSASFKVRTLEDVAAAITVSMGSSPSYSFASLMGLLNDRSQSKAGDTLDNVYNLKVSTENGVLYYGYTSPESPGHGVGGTERYYYQPSGQGQMALRDVSFVPLPGFDGTAVVDYNAVSANGSTFTGTIRIEATATGDVAYSTAVDQPVAFAAEHFSAVCKGRNGQAIRYVTFVQPSSSRGTLYYNYSPTGQYSPKVDSSTRYYASSNPTIDKITFVPAEGFAGEVDVTYRCTDSSGATYTGTVTITVIGVNGSQSSDVEYSTGRNQRQALSASDFNDACRRTAGGTLDYIRFTSLPGSGTGVLYLNYSSSSSTRVSTNWEYYRSSSPRISNITFVPATDYSGTVSIPFTAANTDGTTFSGNLIIHVDDGAETVRYNTPRNQPVTFDAVDFNNASRRISGASLNRVRFTSLPGSSSGTLYYDYASSGSRVSIGTDYRRSGSPALSSVTFVPASNYSGTVSIPFTAYDDNGGSFTGTVAITVGSGSGRIISYSTVANGSVRFDRADFNNACRSATGDALDYVHFDLPASRYGKLYHQYNASSRTGNSVSSGTSYYYSGSSRLVGDVSFAASALTGTVSLGYTGYSAWGDSFSGTVEIQVSSPSTVNSVIYYTGSSAPVSFRSSDFQNLCQAALGNPLSYVQFNALPAVGRLNQNYSGPARTGAGVTATGRYGIQELDQISYLPKAEYQGTITIPFTLYDTQGASQSGTVEIQLSNAYCSASFTDTASGWNWAKPSIEFLRQSGITNGYGNNTYRPGQSISRGEFTLMICRAFQFPTTGSSGFPDVPAGSAYAGAVASARNLGIVQGNNGLFQPDRPITRQSAMTMICRALRAAGQAVPTADTGLLNAYSDGGQVSAFARPSVAALVQMGVVRGNSAMRLNPTASISRAEMAVILHRVLTR